MPWREDIDLLEQKVADGQEAQQELNDAIAAANIAQEKYNALVAEIEALKGKLQNSIGSIFAGSNVKVRTF